MKNILIVSPDTTGTIPSIAYTLYKTLKKCEECSVYVAVMRNSGSSPFPVDFTYVYNSKSGGYFSKIQFLKRIKKERKIDITISTLTACNTFNVLSKVKDKTIGIFHAPLAQTKNVSYLNYLRCKFSYSFIFKKLDKRYAVSETVKADVEKYTGRSAELVYNIHDFGRIFSLASEKLTSAEQQIFTKPTALYVGHLYDTKGVRRLIQAFSQVNSDANLVIVGEDENKSIPTAYKELAEECNVDKRVFFLGYQDNPYKYMKNCSAFILPSYSEGLPGVLIEALSLNRKVITTNSSKGVWEIMQCYNSYLDSLSAPFETELGIITSNDDSNNECIRQLSDSMNKLLSESDNTILPFDKSRFDGDSLAHYYINI